MSDVSEEKQLEALLDAMRTSGLPVQSGGLEVEALPTGIASFDHSTGIGGIPRKRISLFHGEEHSGKSLLLLALIANTQRGGGRGAFIDAEHALTPDFARLLGVNFDDLIVSRPRTLDEAYDVARRFCASGLFDVVGLDSAVSLATAEELESNAGEASARAALARMHSQELRKMNSGIHDRTAFVIINQLRENPNPPVWHRGGKLLYSPGGKALKHYSSLTVLVKKRKQYTVGDEKIGQQIETYTEKNKVGAPFKKAEFDMMFATGLDLLSNLIETALRMGVIRQKSSSFYFDLVENGEVKEENLRFAGRKTLDDALRTNAHFRTTVEQQVNAIAEAGDEFDDIGEQG